MKTSRRRFLTRSAALAGLSTLARPALASAGDRKFLFVFNFGGWDTTRVLAPLFDNPVVSMEDDAAPATAGGLLYVDHPERPAVRRFFETWHDQCLMLHGLLVPSVAHANCKRLMMTGRSAGNGPDWPAILAAGGALDIPLPNLVLSGPSYPGDLAEKVSRVGFGGQLEALLSGDLVGWSDVPVSTTDPSVASLEAGYLRQQATRMSAASASATRKAQLDAYGLAAQRAGVLRAVRDEVPWALAGAFTDQLQLAVELLTQGLSRVVTVESDAFWDTHDLNDVYQSWYWEDLFDALDALMGTLWATPGDTTASLAEETVVVVLSEMGRAPQLNASQGKDHWPYTSALLIGPGLTTDRVVGGYDSLYYGQTVDPASGELSDSGAPLDVQALGALLLAAGDVDPGDWTDDAPLLEGLLG
ncbi:MAG: DUF1501 domain-containing protein [Alphaproteobacteria bacterium]|nr:DUF1501 domain-containing protein [Alphaproteobacteria bacterium]